MTLPELIAVGVLVYALLLYLLIVFIVKGRGASLPASSFTTWRCYPLGFLVFITLEALLVLCLMPLISLVLVSESFWRGFRPAVFCRTSDEATCREIGEVRRWLRGCLGSTS